MWRMEKKKNKKWLWRREKKEEIKKTSFSRFEKYRAGLEWLYISFGLHCKYWGFTFSRDREIDDVILCSPMVQVGECVCNVENAIIYGLYLLLLIFSFLSEFKNFAHKFVIISVKKFLISVLISSVIYLFSVIFDKIYYYLF